MSKAEADQQKKEIVLEYFNDVPVYRYAAMVAGVSEDTLARWRKDDEEFADSLNQAKARWVRKRVADVKADWALERLEREIFSPPVNKTETTSIDPVMILLQKFGVMEAIEGERKAPDAIQDSSKSGT